MTKTKEESKAIGEDILATYKEIAFMIPTYKVIPAVFFHSFFITLKHLHFAGFNVRLFFVDNTNVCKSRNSLAGNLVQFIREKGYEPNVCIWLDSDHQFEMDDIMNLLYHMRTNPEVKILSGRYVTRDLVAPRVCGFMSDGEGKYIAISPETKGIVEVDGFGFGFVAMYPEVLEKMYDEYGEHQFLFKAVGPKEKGGMIGEDLDWCEKAKKLGYKLYFDNSIQVGHYGGIIDEDVLRVKLEKYGFKFE